MPSPYSSKHFKEDTLPFSVHDVPRYLSGAFQPLFPRQRIRGFKVLDQLHDTSKRFPTLCSPLQVSRSFHPQRELLCWPQCKARAILGRLPGLHSWNFIEQDSGRGRTLPPSKEPHQHLKTMRQLCKTWHAASCWARVQLWAVPAGGLALGVLIKSNHTFHWRLGPQVNNRHIKDGTFWAQLSRARRWMFKINQDFFFSSGSEFTICFSLLLSVCAYVCMQLFPLLLKHIHTYLLQYPICISKSSVLHGCITRINSATLKRLSGAVSASAVKKAVWHSEQSTDFGVPAPQLDSSFTTSHASVSPPVKVCIVTLSPL